MNKNHIVLKIFKSIFALYYLAIAIIIFIFLNNPNFVNTHSYFASLVLAGSIPHLVIYFMNNGFRSAQKSGFLIVGIVGVALGFIFEFSETMTINQICMYWGILDICRGAIEISDTLPHLKHNKLEIIELVVSTGDIALGILLCIHLEEGIKLHLTYFAIAFVLYAVKMVIEYIFQKIKVQNV